MTRILFGGDICPIGNIQSLFVEGSADKIFHNLLSEITNVDLSIVNLECPLISAETPITKAGPVLGADIRCIGGFVESKWNVLNLANNHSYDHGSIGLLETIDTIKKAGIDIVGAGENLNNAQIPLVREINGERIVIYSMAEREFSIADKKTPGANPFDLINCVNAIRHHKQQGIFIALIHGGKEYYQYPSPEMVRKCRFLVDMGADAVICCHTHCPLPWEIYADRPIVYGLGNFIFEADRQEPDSWYEGYLSELTIENRKIQFKAIPYFQSKGFNGAQKMDEVERKHFFDEMEKKCRQLKDETFLDNHWSDFCRGERDNYLSLLFGYNRPMRKLKKILLPFLHSKKATLRSLLLVQCETHQEVLNTIFREEKSI